MIVKFDVSKLRNRCAAEMHTTVELCQSRSFGVDKVETLTINQTQSDFLHQSQGLSPAEQRFRQFHGWNHTYSQCWK